MQIDEFIHDPATGLFKPYYSAATQDGQDASGIPVVALGVWNGSTVDRASGTNKILNTNPRTLAAGASGDSVNANRLKGVLYQGSVPLQATFTVGPLDVSLYQTVVIDWAVTGTFTGTSVGLIVNSIDESGTPHPINSNLSVTAVGNYLIFLGINANSPGSNVDTGNTRRYPDPFRRKINLVFTETGMTVLTSTVSVVGE